MVFPQPYFLQPPPRAKEAHHPYRFEFTFKPSLSIFNAFTLFHKRAGWGEGGRTR